MRLIRRRILREDLRKSIWSRLSLLLMTVIYPVIPQHPHCRFVSHVISSMSVGRWILGVISKVSLFGPSSSFFFYIARNSSWLLHFATTFASLARLLSWPSRQVWSLISQRGKERPAGDEQRYWIVRSLIHSSKRGGENEALRETITREGEMIVYYSD